MESQNTERAVADRVCECVLSRPPLEKEIKDLAGMEQGCRKVKRSLELVLYPLLRVEIPKLKGERVGDIPPGLLRPLSMEALHLQEDSDLCSRLTAKGDSLAKLAP